MKAAIPGDTLVPAALSEIGTMGKQQVDRRYRVIVHACTSLGQHSVRECRDDCHDLVWFPSSTALCYSTVTIFRKLNLMDNPSSAGYLAVSRDIRQRSYRKHKHNNQIVSNQTFLYFYVRGISHV
jgi:hypothetical protein